MEHTHYKCRNCGSVFRQENAHKVNGIDGEYEACPRCEYVNPHEFTPCENCGKEMTDEEIEYGLCKECLIKLADYETAYDFMKSVEELPLFMFEYVLGVREPVEMNDLLMQEIEMMFKRHKVEDLLYNKPLLLNKIKEFIEEDLCRFSDYLKEKGGL